MHTSLQDARLNSARQFKLKAISITNLTCPKNCSNTSGRMCCKYFCSGTFFAISTANVIFSQIEGMLILNHLQQHKEIKNKLPFFGNDFRPPKPAHTAGSLNRHVNKNISSPAQISWTLISNHGDCPLFILIT